jgi:hypothetical protein
MADALPESALAELDDPFAQLTGPLASTIRLDFEVVDSARLTPHMQRLRLTAPQPDADLIDRAAAGCVLDDLCREAAWPGVEWPGVRVTAADLGGHRTGPVMPGPGSGSRAEAGRGRAGDGQPEGARPGPLAVRAGGLLLPGGPFVPGRRCR